MPINTKTSLKHITQYWNPKHSSLQEANIVNLTRTSTALTPKESKQSELNIFTVPHMSFFSFSTISFMTWEISQVQKFWETNTVRLPVKSNLSMNTEVFSPSVCS